MKIFDASSVICILTEINFPKILDVCKENGYSIARLMIAHLTPSRMQKGIAQLKLMDIQPHMTKMN